ncbi:hypothetical protein [Rufibacter latericius]|uniref:Uncharacterized protein n=1 Tax=Rufibacter latericius TaxID=2487040 RepID=A0A3M9M906_9BACT|nr:hypothetical protein [Rufibacter latericius]RNI22041.1 hypothetical protein EFB08_23195 [Rufibacter latericius]
MVVKKLTGLRVLPDPAIVTTKFAGFSISTIENLFISVRREQGQLIPSTIILIVGGEIAGEYLQPAQHRRDRPL